MRLASLVAVTFSFLAVACASTSDPVGSGGQSDVYETTITPGDSSPEGDTGGDPGDGDATSDKGLVGASETVASKDLSALLQSTTLIATSDVNLRSGAGTTYDILAVIPEGAAVTLIDATAQNSYLHVQFNGQQGWAHGNYFVQGTAKAPATGGVAVNAPPSPANALARAKTSVGFSYWWGYGGWVSTGATSSNAGSCTGSCPTCSHKGSYGADCSGMVAKAWQYGPTALDENAHPYTTLDMVKDVSGKWSTVSRGSMKGGDALVYNSGGHGHVALYEKGDPWGASTVYECRGCAYGCVYNTRAFGSEYHAIRRSGF